MSTYACIMILEAVLKSFVPSLALENNGRKAQRTMMRQLLSFSPLDWSDIV